MDLLDCFFSFSTAHNFSFSNEVTSTSAFDTITSHKFLRDNRSQGANPFTRQVTSPKQVTLGASILGLSFLQAVIRRNDAIVCPHLQSKIQESFEDCG
jgi:hypothetical protein